MIPTQSRMREVRFRTVLFARATASEVCWSTDQGPEPRLHSTKHMPESPMSLIWTSSAGDKYDGAPNPTAVALVALFSSIRVTTDGRIRKCEL